MTSTIRKDRFISATGKSILSSNAAKYRSRTSQESANAIAAIKLGNVKAAKIHAKAATESMELLTQINVMKKTATAHRDNDTAKNIRKRRANKVWLNTSYSQRATLAKQVVDYGIEIKCSAKAGGYWTPQTIETLLNLWDAGHTANEVASAMGITRNKVMGKIDRIKRAIEKTRNVRKD